MVLRFLLLAIVAYWIYRVGGSIMRLFSGNVNDTSNERQSFQRKQNPAKKKNSPKNYKGGEYVDFEEIE